MGGGEISCYVLYKCTQDKWNDFSILCSTDKASIKVSALFGTCQFGKEMASW